jgi:hypothetical protein
MPSDWGARHGLLGYDEFRTGLTYQDVREMLRRSEKHMDRHDRPHDRRHTVLGFLHEIKLQLYYRAVDQGYLDERVDEAR